MVLISTFYRKAPSLIGFENWDGVLSQEPRQPRLETLSQSTSQSKNLESDQARAHLYQSVPARRRGVIGKRPTSSRCVAGEPFPSTVPILLL